MSGEFSILKSTKTYLGEISRSVARHCELAIEITFAETADFKHRIEGQLRNADALAKDAIRIVVANQCAGLEMLREVVDEGGARELDKGKKDKKRYVVEREKTDTRALSRI